MMQDENDVKLPSASQWVRGLGALIGLVMMVIGVVYSVRIFGWISEGLREPEKVSDLVRRWGLAMGGGAAFEINLGDTIPLSEILAVLVLGVAMWVLIRIAFLFLSVGSTVIRNTLGEKEAIREILKYTFGPGQVKPHSQASKQG